MAATVEHGKDEVLLIFGNRQQSSSGKSSAARVEEDKAAAEPVTCRRATITDLSDYFKALFEHKMLEGLTGRASLTDISLESGKILVRYAQLLFEQNSTPSQAALGAGIDQNNARLFMRLADRFQIDSLSNVLDSLMLEYVRADIDNIDLVECFVFASWGQLSQTLEMLEAAILAKFPEIRSSSFTALPDCCLLRRFLASERLNSSCAEHEIHVMNSLLGWALTNCSSAEECDHLLVDLFGSCVDYRHLSAEIILDFVEGEPLMRNLPHLYDSLLKKYLALRDGFVTQEMLSRVQRVTAPSAVLLSTVEDEPTPEVEGVMVVNDASGEEANQAEHYITGSVKSGSLCLVDLENARRTTLPLPFQSPSYQRGMAVCSNGVRIYFSGGKFKDNPDGLSDQVFCYDTITKRYKQMTSLPSSRWLHQMWVHETELFVIGGFGDCTFTKPLLDLWSLDLTVHTWRKRCQLPSDDYSVFPCDVCNSASFWGQVVVADDGTVVLLRSDKLYRLSYVLEEWLMMDIELPQSARGFSSSCGVHDCPGVRTPPKLFYDHSSSEMYLVESSYTLRISRYDQAMVAKRNVSNGQELAGYLLHSFYKNSGRSEQKWCHLTTNPFLRSCPGYEPLPLFVLDGSFYFVVKKPRRPVRLIFADGEDTEPLIPDCDRNVYNMFLTVYNTNTETERYIGFLPTCSTDLCSTIYVPNYY